jgi:hypothetical protein
VNAENRGVVGEGRPKQAINPATVKQGEKREAAMCELAIVVTTSRMLKSRRVSNTGKNDPTSSRSNSPDVGNVACKPARQARKVAS